MSNDAYDAGGSSRPTTNAPGSTTVYEPPRDSATRSPVVDIVDAVAAAADSSPDRLPPLAEWVDTDALNDLFAPASGADSSVRVTFRYADYVVAVDRDSVVVRTDENGPVVARRRRTPE